MSSSRDGSKVVFASNFGLQSILGYPANYSDAYLIDVSNASPNTGGTSSSTSTTSSGITGTGSATTGGTTSGSTSATTASTGSTTTSSTPTTGTTTGTTNTPATPPPATTPTTAVTPTLTRIEDNNATVAYTGSWFNNTSTAQSGSHAVLSMDAGSTSSLTFNGTGVTVLGFRDEWSGIARVYLDGSLKSEVDTYAATSVAKVPLYSVSDLAQGTHTVKIEVTGTMSALAAGKWVWIDAFDVQSGLTSSTTSTSTTSSGSTATAPASAPAPTGTPYRVEENNAAVQSSGSWSVHTGSAHSGNSAKLSMTAGDRATLKFVGTSVTWIGFRDPWSGIARVYIDNVLQAEIDTYSASSDWKAPLYTASNLAWGTHTITIEAEGRRGQNAQGAWIWVDAFDYVGDPLN